MAVMSPLSGVNDRREASAPARRRQRRVLSCLPCREAKLRCNRAVPCRTCTQHGREDRCRRNPPPAAALTPVNRRVLCTSSTSLARVEVRRDGVATPLSSLPDLSSRTPNSQNNLHATSLPSPPTQDDSIPEELTTVESAVLSRPYSIPDRTLLDEPPLFWKHHLISILPSRTQCDILTSYFFENVNWVYQAIHAPSFRSEYTRFWTSDVPNVDLIWLALLYMILCIGGVFIPSPMAEAVGLEATDLPKLSKRWYSASRQALHSGGYDIKPTLTQIQVFLISQLYWYSTQNLEGLNSHLGQAIRNAQALGLDKESPPTVTNCLQREMRHRLWWDLAASDTFQSLCLGRQALLRCYLSTVPFPSNCNDIDITPTSIRIRPLSEPTEMSVHHFRARVFKVFNKLYIDNGANLSSYEFVASIDGEIAEILDEYPWYMRGDGQRPSPQHHLPPTLTSIITWMRHVLHTSICMQRVRMYRPFLKPLIGDAWKHCVASSTSALSIYKLLRSNDVARFQRSPKMHIQIYQAYSAAVTLATFLLVEMPLNADLICADIELLMEDLTAHSSSLERIRRGPLMADGPQIIRRILDIYRARCEHTAAKKNTTMPTPSSPTQSRDDAPTALVPAIFSVIGGESTAHRYLERCSGEDIANASTSTLSSTRAPPPTGAASTGAAVWDAFSDIHLWCQWGDIPWADLDSILAIDDSHAF